MAQDPWAEFRTGAPAAKPAPQAPAFPGVIRGTPDPMKVRDQQLQEDAAARAARAEDRADRAEQRATASDARSAEKDKIGGVEQSKSAAFLLRALGANDSYEAQDIGARSYVGQKLADTAPDALNMLPGAIGNSPRRQVADTSQDEFIAASLRQDSGAAIPPEEMDRQRRIYFPMPGEDEQTREAKKQARLRAIEGLKQSSGPLADQTVAKFLQMPKTGRADDASLFGEGLTGTVTDDSPAAPGGPNPPTDSPTPPDGGRGIDPNGIGGLLELGKQGITLGLSDEAAGVGASIGAALMGDDPMRAYQQEKASTLDTIAKARTAWPVAGTVAEFLGGGGAAKIAQAPSGLAQIVRQGAGMGGLAGFGYGEGGNSLPNALLGAATGGAVGGALYGASRGVNALRSPRGNVDMDVIAAGQRQNIPVRQPDARPDLRGKYAALESSERGGRLISATRADDTAAIEQRAADVAGGTAYAVADRTAMGQRVQNIARSQEGKVKGAASTLYERVDRTAPGFSTPANQTAAFIDNKIAELRAASPTGYDAEVKALMGMKSDLQTTGLSVRTLQAQRETVGGRIGDNVQDRTRADRTFTQVLDVAASELHSSMRSANPQAAAMLQRADAKWSQYKRLQQEVTGLFLGKRGDATAESAARSLDAMTRENYSALRRFMTLASPEDRADFAATFVQKWGANQRGEFTPSLFAKKLANVNDRTLNALVGPDGRLALRDLQLLSNAKTDAMARQAPSGKAIERTVGGLKTLLMTALGFSTGGPAGAVAGGAARELLAKWGEQRAARMLLNPDFTKWLRNAPNATNPKAIDRYFAKLGTMTSIAANDNAAFVSALRNTLGRSPGTAAAEQEQDARQVPPQQ